MAFNSPVFLIFFAAVAVLYWAVPHRFRCILLLSASYYFYASWRVEYVALLAAITLISYFTGRFLEGNRPEKRRKICFVMSLGASLGLLLVFKYLGFAMQSANVVLHSLGLSIELPIPEILLPVGVSFYTFQAVGYTIDVMRRERHAERNIGMFALFVSFFPQLVAGPIERSSRLLPQIHARQRFSYLATSNGLKLMAWGFFKKLVIADRIAVAVNRVYGSPTTFTGLPLLVATYLFAFQILCDFSAYTDIARGAAQILGFDLMCNFRRPYFATSVREFWRRWHVSLTSWFRDYLYIPLGGSRVPVWRWFLNLLIVFLVSGLWHGAGLTFVLWGGLHAVFLVVGIATKQFRDRAGRKIFGERGHGIQRFLQMVVTFNLVCLGWVVFRAYNVQDAWYVATHMFSGLRIRPDLGMGLGIYETGIAMLAISALLVVDLLQERSSVLALVRRQSQPIRWAIYCMLVLAILCLAKYGYEEFIYFQF